jgi:hypothetical protein
MIILKAVSRQARLDDNKLDNRPIYTSELYLEDQNMRVRPKQ